MAFSIVLKITDTLIALPKKEELDRWIDWMMDELIGGMMDGWMDEFRMRMNDGALRNETSKEIGQGWIQNTMER